MCKTLAAKVQCASDDQFLWRLFSIQSIFLIWELCNFSAWRYFWHFLNFIFKGYKCSLCRVGSSRIQAWSPRKGQNCMVGKVEHWCGWRHLRCPVRAGSSQLWLCVSEDNEKIPVEWNSWIWVSHLHTICILGGYWGLGMLDMLVTSKRDPSKM